MRPPSIIRFDQLYLGSLAFRLVIFALGYDALIAKMKAGPGAAELGLDGPGIWFAIVGFGKLGISMVILLLLWWLASRRASNVARWILAIFAALRLVILLPLLGDLSMLQMPQIIAEVVFTAVQIAAVWFLFRPDAAAWFRHGPRGMDADVFA